MLIAPWADASVSPGIVVSEPKRWSGRNINQVCRKAIADFKDAMQRHSHRRHLNKSTFVYTSPLKIHLFIKK